MNKREREARNAIQTIVRGLRDQLRAMLTRQMDAHMGDLIAHAQEGRGFRLNIQIMNGDGSTWLGDPAAHAEHTEAVGQVERQLQLVKDEEGEIDFLAEVCANCGHARMDHHHTDHNCLLESCRCQEFMERSAFV